MQRRQEPGADRGSCLIEDHIDSLLQLLDAMFHRVLELLEGFTEPFTYQHCSQVHSYLVAGFSLSIASEEAIGCTAVCDALMDCVQELLLLGTP